VSQQSSAIGAKIELFRLSFEIKSAVNDGHILSQKRMKELNLDSQHRNN
jgi:hypothetical protein